MTSSWHLISSLTFYSEEEGWFLLYNTFTTILLTFHHHRAGVAPHLTSRHTYHQRARFAPNLMSGHTRHHRTDPSSNLISGYIHKGAPNIERRLHLKINPSLKWDAYIRAIANDADRMVVSLHHYHKHLTPLAIYKSQMRQRIECCCHIWNDSVQSLLSNLSSVQKRLHGRMRDELFSKLR